MIKTVVIPTGSRPAAVSRLIPQLLKHLEIYGRSADIVIADISVETSSGMPTSELRSLTRRGLFLLDGRARETLHVLLARGGCDERDISFCLGERSLGRLSNVGATRNLLLLMCTDKCFLSLDDDVELDFVSSSTLAATESYIAPNRSRVDLKWHADGSCDTQAVHHWFFENREELDQACSFEQIDFIACHERLLQQVSELDHEEGLGRGRPEVAVSLSGIVGDCGWGTPSEFFFMDTASAEPLFKSESDFKRFTQSRQVLRVAPRTHLSRRPGSLMTTAYAANGACELPPFFPLGRGMDLFFGHVINLLHPSYRFGHIPYAIKHSPLENRNFWPGEYFRSAKTTDLSGLLYGVVSDICVSGATTQVALGEALVAHANLTDASFMEYLRYIRSCQSRDRIAKLQILLQSIAQHSGSARHQVETFILKVESGAESEDGWLPVELLRSSSHDQAIETTKELVHRYGSLLQTWGDMRSISRGWMLGELNVLKQ